MEAIFLDCGAGGPQLKRNPLGCTHTEPSMPPYQAQFPVGSRVRIASLERLEEFMRTWRYHHPLGTDQLRFAGQVVTVRELGYYHGGDVLYELDGAPGTWHEGCLSGVEVKGAA